MDHSMTLDAYAKINLFLDITGRRADGYHTITGIMHAVSLHDTVTVSVEPAGGQGGISLTCSNPALPTDGRNLGYRAAAALLAAAGVDPAAVCVCVHIEKRIPFAAGLAGGSTDAAAVLKALNALLADPALPGSPLNAASLAAVGLSLGADVPFCMVGGAQITEGIGEVLTPCPTLPDCDILIACAGAGVSTPAAYGALDARCGSFAPSAYTPHTEALNALLSGLTATDPADALTAVSDHAFNLFETVILPVHEIARTLKARMRGAGAVCTLMSGSGPSVFGLFDRSGGRSSAQSLCRILNGEGIPAWVCRPIGAPR